MTEQFGVSSEVGKLRKVLAHRPDASLRRLTPDNCHDLLFDDVLWVQKAREEHDVFADHMRERGVEVLLVGDLLAETLENAEARAWLLDRKLTADRLGGGLVPELHAYLQELPATSLATAMLAGIAARDLTAMTLGADDFVLPPLPNHLFTRDTTCWIGNGVTLNPMRRPGATRRSTWRQSTASIPPSAAPAFASGMAPKIAITARQRSRVAT